MTFATLVFLTISLPVDLFNKLVVVSTPLHVLAGLSPAFVVGIVCGYATVHRSVTISRTSKLHRSSPTSSIVGHWLNGSNGRKNRGLANSLTS